MSILDLQAEQQPVEVQQLKARMQQIQSELTTKTPGLPEALADIHRILLSHEDLVHMLDDDDINKLHKAFELHKQVTMIQKETKKPSSRKKLSNDDLASL